MRAKRQGEDRSAYKCEGREAQTESMLCGGFKPTAP